MGYKVLYRGLDVICETLDEVDALADRLENGPVVEIARDNGHRVQKLSVKNDAATIRDFLVKLPEAARDFLHALVNAPRGALDDTELRTLLNLDNNMQLSAITTNLLRVTRRRGMEEVFAKEVVIDRESNTKRQVFSIPSTIVGQLRETLREMRPRIN